MNEYAGKTILLVEDEPIIALSGKRTIERFGFPCLWAGSGEEAVRIVDSQDDIALILMDIDLGPGMDGRDAAMNILASHDLPLAFLSSHTEPEVVERTEGITSYGYILKNSGSTVLLACIKMAFRLHEARLRERQAMQALIQSHNLMSYIIQHSRSAIAVHDRDLRYLFVSRRYLEEYRIEERDVIGRHHYEVFPDLPQKWRDVHQRALGGEVACGEEDPYVRADGSVDWTRWECRPWYESDGAIGGIIVYTEVVHHNPPAAT